MDVRIAQAIEENVANQLKSEMMDQFFGKTATVLKSSHYGSSDA
jgi:hypothetical protein